MKKIIIEVDGMMCNMCENHVNEAVRNNFNVKKVTSSHKKGVTEILTEDSIEKGSLTKVISDLGYTVGDVEEEDYKKKGLFGF